MEELLKFLADDGYVRAFANIFGIIAGLIIVYKGGAYVLKFLTDVVTSSIKTAYVRLRNRFARNYIYASEDIFLLAIHLSMIQAALIFSVAGLIVVNVNDRTGSPERLRQMFAEQNIVGNYETYQSLQEFVVGFSNLGMMASALISTQLLIYFAGGVRRVRRRWRRRHRLHFNRMPY